MACMLPPFPTSPLKSSTELAMPRIDSAKLLLFVKLKDYLMGLLSVPIRFLDRFDGVTSSHAPFADYWL